MAGEKTDGKYLKIGMIGDGMKSFMGGVHREAIAQTGRLRIVGGAFGTSKQASYDFIKPLGLNVDDVLITDELGGVQFRKPCDIAFRIMLTRWRLNPADIIYVGDNIQKDFQAPQQIGMRSIALNNRDGLYVFQDALYKRTVLSHICDLTEYLARELEI